MQYLCLLKGTVDTQTLISQSTCIRPSEIWYEVDSVSINSLHFNSSNLKSVVTQTENSSPVDFEI